MRDERLYLEDIVQASGMIASFLSGISEEKWADDEQLRSAVTYQLIVIGEAASRVSLGLRGRHPEVPWPDVVAFRNLAVHAYFAMDPHIVWVTAQADVPALSAAVTEILRVDFPA